MLPLLYIAGSIIVDLIVVLIVGVIVWYIIKLILDSFPPTAGKPFPRNVIYALFLLLFLGFVLYRYLGEGLP